MVSHLRARRSKLFCIINKHLSMTTKSVRLYEECIDFPVCRWLRGIDIAIAIARLQPALQLNLDRDLRVSSTSICFGWSWGNSNQITTVLPLGNDPYCMQWWRDYHRSTPSLNLTAHDPVDWFNNTFEFNPGKTDVIMGAHAIRETNRVNGDKEYVWNKLVLHDSYCQELMMSQNNLINALFTEINIWKLWTYLVFQVNRNGRSMPVGIKEIEEETDDEMCVYNSLNNYNMVVGMVEGRMPEREETKSSYSMFASPWFYWCDWWWLWYHL